METLAYPILLVFMVLSVSKRHPHVFVGCLFGTSFRYVVYGRVSGSLFAYQNRTMITQIKTWRVLHFGDRRPLVFLMTGHHIINKLQYLAKAFA